MQTLTIELLNPKARTILEGLESAGLIVIGTSPKSRSFMEWKNFSEENFWYQKSVEELAGEQCVDPVNDLERLFGCGKDLWETEEEWNDYMESVQMGRKEKV